MMTKAVFLRSATALAVLALTVPALAQKVDAGAPDTRVVPGSDVGTGILNREEAQRAAQEDQNNVQNAQVYQRQLDEHNRAVNDANLAQRNYEADLARNAAQNAAYQEQQRAYERAMAQWRADVAACNAGNRSRCGTQQPR